MLKYIKLCNDFKHLKAQTHNMLPPIFIYQYLSIDLTLLAHIYLSHFFDQL